MARAFRIFAAIIALIGFGWSHAHAQVPMTGAGRGAPVAAGGGSVTRQDLGTALYQATSNNFNYTGLTITGGLTNPGLVCFLIRAHASNNVEAGAALTWNGVSVPLQKVQDNGGVTTAAAFLFGLRNPASGPQTLNVSATNVATDNFVNCVSFSNVNPASDALAFPNPTGTTTASTLAVTSANGHIAVGSFFGNAGTPLGTIVINDATSGAIINAAADYVVSSGASTTIGTSSVQTALAGMDVSN